MSTKPDPEAAVPASSVEASSKRQNYQREHRESEERFRLLVESVRDYAIFMLDRDGFIVSWNAGAERIKGYTADEAIGEHFSRFYTEEDRASGKPQSGLKTARTQGRYEEAGWRIRKDGSRFFADVIITPVKDKRGHHTGFAKVTRDMTEQRRADEEKNALLRQVQEAAARQRLFLREILASVTEGRLLLCESEAELPASPAPPYDSMPLTAPTLRSFRQHVVDVAIAKGFPPERWQDLVTAVGEAAMNAVVHGGEGTGSVCTGSRSTIQVRIEDKGEGIALEKLHRATLERGYTTAGSLGHGFWMILKTADRFWLLTGPSGTTVVIEQDKVAKEPSWLDRF